MMYWVHVVSCFVSPEVVSGRCAVGKLSQLLNYTVLKTIRKRVVTKEFVNKLRGSVSQNLISDLVRTSFVPRPDLIKNCSQSKPSPERFWEGLAMVCYSCPVMRIFSNPESFHSLSNSFRKASRNIPSDYYSNIFVIYVWGTVHMMFNTRGYIFSRLWDTTVHTHPDGDLENLAIEKCIARNLKITILYSSFHGILDLVALIYLIS